MKLRLTCRFLLIFRMLCCNRKLLSRAKRLCWSSSWARRSWKRTVASDSWNATVSLRRPRERRGTNTEELQEGVERLLPVCRPTSRCSRSSGSGTVGCPWGRGHRTAGPPAPGTCCPASGAGPTAPSSGEQVQLHQQSGLKDTSRSTTGF